MDKASEALADVHGWLCDNLSAGDAGKICGMLSVVSRHIVALEDENAKLDRRRRSLHADVGRLGGIIHRQRKELSMMQHVIECRNDENAEIQEENARLRSCLSDDAENARQIMGENAELRECLQDFADAIKNDDGFGVDRGWMLERIRELGIKEKS